MKKGLRIRELIDERMLEEENPDIQRGLKIALRIFDNESLRLDNTLTKLKKLKEELGSNVGIYSKEERERKIKEYSELAESIGMKYH